MSRISAPIEIRHAKGSRLPDLAYTLREEDGTRYAIPSGATVAFVMRSMDTNALVVDSAAATKAQTSQDTHGDVTYAWAADDVDTAGRYWGWFVVTVSSKTRTFPQDRALRIIITEAAS